MKTQRELFEQWAESYYMPCESNWFVRDQYNLQDYKLDFVQEDWEAFQSIQLFLRVYGI